MRKKNIKRVTIKIGTSTLTYKNGKLNYKNIEILVRTIADLKNRDIDVILVTSGAIGVGMTRLMLEKKPNEISKKQAIAAIGQLELMYTYNKLFREYNINIGQVLLTKDCVFDPKRKINVVNTINELLNYKVLPIVNENDTIAVDEIVFGDNDTLSAYVADLSKSDLLLILTDIDGLYDKNPREHSSAKQISVVEEIDDHIKQMATDTNSTCGTGGMITKLLAGEIVNDHGIDMVIANGENTSIIFDVLDGKPVGTLFKAKKK
ncbi:MAG: glutamate 5-kinase [Clostridia bacterium]